MDPAVCNTTSNCEGKLAHELNNDFWSVMLPVTVFVGVEGVVGFIFNILVLYVYVFRYRVCNFRCFVICLACFDVLGCLTTIPGEIATHRYWYVYPYPLVCKMKSFFNVFTSNSPALLLVIVALDRFLKVCRPNGWQMRPRTALILCGIGTVIGFGVSLPTAIFWGLRTYPRMYKGVDINVTICEKDQTYEHSSKPFVHLVVDETFVGALMLVLALLYIAIARQMFKPESSLSSSPGGPGQAQGSSTSIAQQEGRHIFEQQPSYHSTDRTGQSESLTDDEDRQEPSTSRATSNRTVQKRPRVAHRHHQVLGESVRRKTLIMFLMTAVFMVTTLVYLTLVSVIADPANVLDSMTNSQKTVYFFFDRIYFVNHVVNPIIYGFLDPECRIVIKSILCRQ